MALLRPEQMRRQPGAPDAANAWRCGVLASCTRMRCRILRMQSGGCVVVLGNRHCYTDLLPMLRLPLVSQALPPRAICSSHCIAPCREDGRSPKSRQGLTLLEILLASVILAGALAALAQQNSTGVKAALRSQLETEAGVHCQSVLNRLLAEGIPASDVLNQNLPRNERWLWSAQISDSQFDGLSVLTVTVCQDGPNRRISTFRLSRLVEKAWQETQ